jgi:hypothetical protein
MNMAGDEAVTHLRIQEYLDDVSNLEISRSHAQWYNIDVASLLSNCKLLGHEVDADDGSSLIFLEKSVMLCCPTAGKA